MDHIILGPCECSIRDYQRSEFTKGMKNHVRYTASNCPEGHITGEGGTGEDNVIPPTRYASPGESLNCHVIRSGWLTGHVSEENMVAVSALPR